MTGLAPPFPQIHKGSPAGRIGGPDGRNEVENACARAEPGRVAVALPAGNPQIPHAGAAGGIHARQALEGA